MLNAHLNFIRALQPSDDYPHICFDLALNGMKYDFAVDADIAVPLLYYIRRPEHWHLPADEDSDDPLENLRRSCILQGQLEDNDGVWYSTYSRGSVAKGHEAGKIELGRFRFVFAAAAITVKLWEDATDPNSDLPDRLRQYVLSHALVFRHAGGIELAMCDFISKVPVQIETALHEQRRKRSSQQDTRMSRR